MQTDLAQKRKDKKYFDDKFKDAKASFERANKNRFGDYSFQEKKQRERIGIISSYFFYEIYFNLDFQNYHSFQELETTQKMPLSNWIKKCKLFRSNYTGYLVVNTISVKVRVPQTIDV